MNFDFDVAVIGGGPIGSTIAYKLSKIGFSTCIIDKKKHIGIPLQCAGIVSKRLKEFNEIPENLILNEARGAFLHSPNHNLKVNKEKTEAFIIDRVSYDQYLSQKAVQSGVKLFKKSKVTAIDSQTGEIEINNEKIIKSKIIVGADGSNSIVSNTFNEKSDFFKGTQFLIKLDENNIDFDKNHKDFVDLHVDSNILPGFLWSIPITDDEYRIGLFSNNSYKTQKKILIDFLNNNPKYENYRIIEKYQGNIPIYDKNKKLVKNRAILIGDAASLLKPTTGGGIVLGFETIQIAIESIENALKHDDINKLNSYEKNFKNKFSKELNYQIKVQNTLKKLSNDDLDHMFMKLKEKNVEEIISKYGDMDKQSVLVKELIKRGIIFSIIPSILYDRVSKIWNF